MQVWAEAERAWWTMHAPLAEGAEGLVFDAPARPDLLAKVFRRPSAQAADRLDAMLADWRQNGPLGDADARVIWPQARLLDAQGSVCGYVMEKARDAVEIHCVYTPVLRARLGWGQLDRRRMVRIARRCAEAYAAAEQRGHFPSDTNGRNLLVDRAARVAVIDADSFQVSWAGRVYTSPCWSDEFAAGEVQGGAPGVRGVESAWFALAVLVFLLLNEGQHPYPLNPGGRSRDLGQGERIRRSAWIFRQSASSPALRRVRPWRDVPEPERRIYLAAFEDGQHIPGKRLSSASIAAALAELERGLAAPKQLVATIPPPPGAPAPAAAAPATPARIRIHALAVVARTLVLASFLLGVVLVLYVGRRAAAGFKPELDPQRRPPVVDRLSREPSMWLFDEPERKEFWK